MPAIAQNRPILTGSAGRCWQGFSCNQSAVRAGFGGGRISGDHVPMTTALLLAINLLPLAGQDLPPAAPAQVLDTVQVRALGLPGRAAFDLPATASVVELEPFAAVSSIDLAGAFNGIPGVLARDRHNRAQDLQLSIRGYGARSTFGVRGIRVLADGLPAGSPDGQAQLSQFNLLDVQRIEVLRGPFAALHGNASGGVVQLLSAPGRADEPWWLQVQAGSDGEAMLGARIQGEQAGMAYRLVPMHWRSDGARQHSRAERSSLSGRFDWTLPGEGTLGVFVQHFDAPDAQDPRALTAAEWQADPRLAAPVARSFNTRKSVAQDQLGLVWEQPLAAGHQARLALHAGQREVLQFLAIPAAAQNNPLHGGGVVDLDNDYAGIDLRVSGQPHPQWQYSAGINSEGQRQLRRGWENFIGQQLGVRGRLRREQLDTVWNLDGHAQLAWQPLPRWQLQAGLRHSRVQFHSADRYITTGNPDDSGRAAYHRSTPVAGLSFAPAPQWRWHLAAGKGLETPTFNELAYRADGGPGLALDLRAARSRQWESGLRWQGSGQRSAALTVFRADTDDELAVARSGGGRSAYRNLGSTRRQGWELEARLPLGEQLQLQAAWTRLDASVRHCAQVAACGALQAGSRLPGTLRDALQLQLQGQHAGWQWQLGASAVSAMAADDANQAQAPGHLLLDAGLSRQWLTSTGPLQLSLALDNLADRRHVSSVVVNDGNGRYYEPGAGRTLRLGLRWALAPRRAGR